MPTLVSARSLGGSRGGEADGGAARAGGNRACYGIAACAVALLLFCALAASVSVWMALGFGGLALVAFAVIGCLGPRHSSDHDGVSAADTEAIAGAAARRTQRRLGLPKAAVNALPAFAYEPSVRGGAEGGGDLESGTTTEAGAGSETCSVCLEDVQAGEMVRQLPACKHLFHLGCIDMWLHSHRTCLVCRCNLLPPPRKVAAKAAPAATADDVAEPPTDDRPVHQPNQSSHSAIFFSQNNQQPAQPAQPNHEPANRADALSPV